MADSTSLSGVLNLNKPVGKTSHDCVYFARRLFHMKKIGHTGTLDPLASGVLPVLVGSAAKLSEYLMNHDKTYRATVRFGLTTDTEDITGAVLSQSSSIPDIDAVREASRAFIGEISQTPPMYSAVKVDGRKLYEYARKGVSADDIKIEPRKVNVYSLAVLETLRPDEYTLDIACSKGTYIRSICAGIGKSLGCGAVMSALVRTSSGCFSIEDSHTQEKLEAESSPVKYLIPTANILETLSDKSICLPEFYLKLAKNGAEIYISKLGITAGFSEGDKVIMKDEQGSPFALGEAGIYDKNKDENIAVKAKAFID
ncbi:tRNA pseudouridine synthase B [Clostridia bacterium]|nr:tRNA pseudouridine synthase B [Clostridia bacterium]